MQVDVSNIKNIPTSKLKFMLGVGTTGLSSVWPKGKDTPKIEAYMTAIKQELASREQAVP